MRLTVIGGGAAGFFAAVTAARLNPNLKVTILEKSSKLLAKVRISGGGRCNVTHACFDVGEMSRNYPRGQHFVKKMFHQFFTPDTIRWFEERGVRLKTEIDGRMFPATDSSDTIIRCLLDEADSYGVSIMLNRDVKGLRHRNKGWDILLSDGSTMFTELVILACGGFPKKSMFDWILETGHRVEEPVPSLFTFNIPGHPLTSLMGISVKAKVKIRDLRMDEEGAVLITHWGISGPAVLKLSARAARELAKANYRFGVLLNWYPDSHEMEFRERIVQMRTEHGSAKVFNRNISDLPQRLWHFLCSRSGINDSTRWAELTASAQKELVKNVFAMELSVEGKTTYKEEFVTAGGVRLDEVDVNTIASKLHRGLYFAGEILDVDGVTGGFNFQHAWTSGWIAGKSASAAAE